MLLRSIVNGGRFSLRFGEARRNIAKDAQSTPRRFSTLRGVGKVTAGVTIVGGSVLAASTQLPTPPPPPLPVINSPEPAPRIRRMVVVTIWALILGFWVGLAHLPFEAFSKWAEDNAVAWLEAGGPTFVKLGQWLATRRDMFSENACEALSRLHTDVKASFKAKEKKEAFARAEREIGVVVDTSKSIGQGCLGQCYGARLKDGSKAVVKVLRPSVDQFLQDDIEIIRFFVHRLLAWRPELKDTAMGEAIDLFGYWMNAQADLTIEAKQLRRFHNNFKDHNTICCPKVHYESRDLLVMDYVEGDSLSSILRSTVRSQFVVDNAELIHDTLGNMMGHMLIQDNFVHQDLHPGNIILERTDQADPWAAFRKKEILEYMPRWMRATLEVNFPPPKPFKVHIIDAGLAVQMEPEESSFFKEMIKASYAKDVVAAGETAYQLHYRHGRTSARTVKEDFVKDIGLLLLTCCIQLPGAPHLQYFPDEESYQKAGLNEYLELFLARFQRHGVRMEPSIWSILCSFALLEGTMRELQSGVNGLQATLPYVFDLRANGQVFLYGRYDALMYALQGPRAAA